MTGACTSTFTCSRHHKCITVQIKEKVRMDPQTSLNKPKILPWDPARSFRYMCLCDHCWSWVIWTPNQNTPWTGQSLWCAYDLWNLEIKPTDLLRKQRLQQLKIHTKHGIKKKQQFYTRCKLWSRYTEEVLSEDLHTLFTVLLRFLLIVPYRCTIYKDKI